MSSLALTPRLALPLHTPKFTRSLLHNARPPRKPQHVFTQSPPSQSQSQSSPPQSSTFNAASQQSSSFTPGTSTPNIHQKNSNIPTQRMIDQPSVVLSYVPPSSASTNGLIGGVPDLLRWVGMGIEMDDHQQTSGTGYGHGIRSSAQRVHAPFRKTPSSSSSSSSSSTSSASPDLLTHLDALSRDTTLLSTMREMRHADPGKWTRSALIKKFSLHPSLSTHLPRLLSQPLPPSTSTPTSSTTRLPSLPLTHKHELENQLQRRKQGWGFKKRVGREMRELRRGMW